MAWTTSHTFTVGEVVTAATMNATLRDNTNFLHDPPGGAFTTTHNSAGDWSVASNTTPVVLTDAGVSSGTITLWDTDTMHSNSLNLSRLSVNTAGVYTVNAAFRWAANASGLRRRIAIFWNGVYHAGQVCQNVTSIPIEQTVSTTIKATAADFFELAACQDTGGALLLSATTSDGTHEMMSASWVGAG